MAVAPVCKGHSLEVYEVLPAPRTKGVPRFTQRIVEKYAQEANKRLGKCSENQMTERAGTFSIVRTVRYNAQLALCAVQDL